MRDLKYQAKKKVRSETNLNSIIQEKYHNHLNIFSKKDLSIFPLYQKYNQKIILEEE